MLHVVVGAVAGGVEVVVRVGTLRGGGGEGELAPLAACLEVAEVVDSISRQPWVP